MNRMIFIFSLKQIFSENSCEQGFSLLELLVVIMILSTIAWMSLGNVSNNMNQVRFEDTLQRLKALRGAVIGRCNSPADNVFLSGFVVDNGRLPENIKALVERPPGYDVFNGFSPLFDPIPDEDGINDGGEITLNQAPQLLMKGHRNYYVTGSSDGMYRDGWGTSITSGTASIDCPSFSSSGTSEGSDLDADNHGWCVTHSANGLFIDSYGLDGQEGELTGDLYEQDVSLAEPILENDWQTNLSGASVKIINQSGTDMDLTASETNLRVSLLIYINDVDSADNFNWLRVTTDMADNTCLDGDGDGLCNGDPAFNDTTATFPLNTSLIPIGEHLLVLVSDPDGLVNTSDDAPFIDGSGSYVTSKIKFFSRAGVPDMVHRIR